MSAYEGDVGFWNTTARLEFQNLNVTCENQTLLQIEHEYNKLYQEDGYSDQLPIYSPLFYKDLSDLGSYE